MWSPLLTWLFSFLVTDKNKNSGKQNDRQSECEEITSRIGISWNILFSGDYESEEKYDICEDDQPPLPFCRRPTPTIEFGLEPITLGIIFYVVNIFFYHIAIF